MQSINVIFNAFGDLGNSPELREIFNHDDTTARRFLTQRSQRETEDAEKFLFFNHNDGYILLLQVQRYTAFSSLLFLAF